MKARFNKNIRKLHFGGLAMENIITKLEDGRIQIKLNKSVYEKEAIVAAAYKLTNSCFIIVKPLESNQLVFTLNQRTIRVKMN